jgi:hypothetical protein
VQGHFKVKLLDLSRGRRYHQAVLILGELFYLTWVIEGGAFSFGVFHFGPAKETESFKYGIKIDNSEEYVAVTRKCHTYLEGGLKDLKPEKYVKLYYNTIQNCLSENTDLSFEIEIGRETLDGFASEELQEILQVSCDVCVSQDSAAGIATRYGLDVPGIEPRLGREFPPSAIQFHWPNRRVIQGGQVLLPGVIPNMVWR